MAVRHEQRHVPLPTAHVATHFLCQSVFVCGVGCLNAQSDVPVIAAWHAPTAPCSTDHHSSHIIGLQSRPPSNEMLSASLCSSKTFHSWALIYRHFSRKWRSSYGQSSACFDCTGIPERLKFCIWTCYLVRNTHEWMWPNSIVQLRASTAVLVDSPMFTGGQFPLSPCVCAMIHICRGKRLVLISFGTFALAMLAVMSTVVLFRLVYLLHI